ncbi:hypothetical protein pb186bvf_004412 [Paramecium bursaria]
MDKDLFVKIIVMGDQGVGKTCILNQYVYGRFEENSAPTIGCDFTTKVTNQNGQTIRLQLWDIAGQEKFNAVSKLYVRGALGCVIVSDITDNNSLEQAIQWKNIVDEHTEHENKLPTYVVQNKVDLLSDRQKFQTIEYLDDFAKKNGFTSSIQTSAKTGQGLKELFEGILAKITDSGLLQSVQDMKVRQSENRQLQENPSQKNPKKKDSCC